jgi:hypothetical protein
VQSTSLRCLFLIDLLFFSHATDGTSKSDPNVKRHSSAILKGCSRYVHSR